MMGNINAKTHAVIDLADAPDYGVALILLELPSKDLLKSCALVSKQWCRILSTKSFWISKSEKDGYKLEWRLFAGLSLLSYQNIGLKKPFARNFVRDSWDLTKSNAQCYQRDSRWKFNGEVVWSSNEYGSKTRIEAPPRFLDGPKPDPDTVEEVPVCLATSYYWFRRHIIIKLEDEGLTNEIMDNFRPPIIVSELVSNRRDCGSVYEMRCRLAEHSDMFMPDEGTSQYWQEDQLESIKSEKNQEFYTKLIFSQWEEESWRKVEHVINEYPLGMRYLLISCGGKDTQFWAGNYGSKMTKFTVKALCQSSS